MAKLTPQERETRVQALTDLSDRVADLLGVDPESVMYDVSANQLCIPASLVARLLGMVRA